MKYAIVEISGRQFWIETGKYYENFSDFSSAIYECLNDAHLKHKKEINLINSHNEGTAK